MGQPTKPTQSPQAKHITRTCKSCRGFEDCPYGADNLLHNKPACDKYKPNPRSKVIRRKMTILADHRIQARPQDNFIVSLYPDSVIGFRRLRSDREVTTTLAACYSMACKAERMGKSVWTAERKAATKGTTVPTKKGKKL